MSRPRPAWPGAGEHRKRRPTAPFASARPTSTAMASSICSPPTTGRSDSSATAARARSRIAPRRGRSRSTHDTTPARLPTSINDGKLDLYVNGTVTGGASWQDSLFRNTGSAFDDVTPRADQEAAGRSRRAVGRRRRRRRSRSGADGIAHRWHALDHAQHAAAPPMRLVRSHVRVVDAKGRATRAGAEVRVFAAGTTRLIGARLVDSGSGYDAQNDMPVHVGVPSGVSRVDVQVIVPAGGKRVPTWQRGVAIGKAQTITVRTN